MAAHTVILEAARAIRPHLQGLLGAEAVEVDRRLADLLGRPDDAQAIALILDELGARPATRDWFIMFIQRHVSPAVADYLGEGEKTTMPPLGGGSPPGVGEAIPGTRFACPKVDYVWYRRVVGEDIPLCPTHDLALVQQLEP